MRNDLGVGIRGVQCALDDLDDAECDDAFQGKKEGTPKKKKKKEKRRSDAIVKIYAMQDTRLRYGKANLQIAANDDGV